MKRIKLILVVVLLAGLMVATACTVKTSALEDIKWVLMDYSVDGETRSLVPDTDVTIFFVSEDKEVNGTGGCNYYFASSDLDGSSLSISGMWPASRSTAALLSTIVAPVAMFSTSAFSKDGPRLGRVVSERAFRSSSAIVRRLQYMAGPPACCSASRPSALESLSLSQ